MKHLLILLSILLLSSPLFGQETGVLYQYETSSGLVWKSAGSEKLQPKFEGQVKNGIPNGQGTVTSSDGSRYVGEFRDGNWNGQGTYTFHDGRKYVGEWKNKEKWNGIGYDKNGDFIVRFVNGEQQ